MSKKNRKKQRGKSKQKPGKTGASTRAREEQKPSKVEQNKASNKAALLAALAETGGFIAPACRAAGLNRDTYYRYLNEDTDFAAAVEEISEDAKDTLEAGLYTIAKAGEDRDRIKASQIILNARAKERGYGSERREISGSLETQTRVEIVARLPDNGRGDAKPK